MAPTKIPSGTSQYDILSNARTYLLDTNASLNVTGEHGIFANEDIHDDTIIIKGEITQSGAGAAIRIDGTDMTIRIDEGGSVTGEKGIASESPEPFSKLNIINDGLIDGGSGYAIETQDSKEIVVNHGTIHGKIYLGSGKDVFDNRGGTLDHRVAGGAGDDTLIVDKAIHKLQENGGSEGYDTVRSTVTYTLSENVERLILLGHGNNDGFGNDDQSDLFGNSGNNKLFGLGGIDILDGGRGNDRLNGGDNADTFVFRTGSGHDTINDFENGIDDIDLSDWAAIINFNDLKNNHLTASGGDLFITAGSDVLVIKDTPKTDLDAGDFIF